MKPDSLKFATALLLTSILFSSCSVVGDIFQAGMGFGIFLVVLVVGLILYFVMRGRNK